MALEGRVDVEAGELALARPQGGGIDAPVEDVVQREHREKAGGRGHQADQRDAQRRQTAEREHGSQTRLGDGEQGLTGAREVDQGSQTARTPAPDTLVSFDRRRRPSIDG